MKRFLAMFMAVAMLCVPLTAYAADADLADEVFANAKAIRALTDAPMDEFAIVAYTKLGISFDKAARLKALEEKAANFSDKTYVTEYAKMAMALHALGVDPYNWHVGDKKYNLYDLMTHAGDRLATPLDYAYVLIALNDVNHVFPFEESGIGWTNLILPLLDMQLPTGGYNAFGEEFNADTTAMVLMALAPLYFGEPLYLGTTYEDKVGDNKSIARPLSEKIAPVIEKCVGLLSLMQTPNGGYIAWDAENTNSAATVASALIALGIDPDTDERFVKDQSLYENIQGFMVEGGGYGYTDNAEVNAFATAQALTCLADYYTMLSDRPYVSFADIDKCAEGTKEAMIRAAQMGLIRGSEGKCYPDQPMTANELAIVLFRAAGIGDYDGYYDVCRHTNFYHINRGDYAGKPHEDLAEKIFSFIDSSHESGDVVTSELVSKLFGEDAVAAFKEAVGTELPDVLTRDYAVALLLLAGEQQ